MKLPSELHPDITYTHPPSLSSLQPQRVSKKDLLFKTKLHDVQIKKTEIVMHIWRAPQRRKGERGNGENRSALLAGEHTTTFLMMVTLSLPVLLFPSKIFRQGTKKISLL
jgi:hypothetical protein